MMKKAAKIVVGPSTTQTPYLVSTADGVFFSSILSVGDQVGFKPDGVTPWKMVGIPDGLGAFDNGDGTITVLMNHEVGNTLGAVRDHGSKGAFVSELVIDKATLEVKSAHDLDQHVFLYNTTTNQYEERTTAFARFCSADLPAVSAFFDETTGLGTKDRIFMNGEETGAEGRSFAHVVTGTDAGKVYELPWMGKFSTENSVANAYSGAKTVIMGQDDTSPKGEVYMYVGDKKSTGNTIEKAGLTGGKLYGIQASFGDDTATGPTSGTFNVVAQGTNGDVSHMIGAQLNAAAAPLTQFGRPEDGSWDPSNPNRYYFATTGAADVPMRIWQMDFIDVEHPELGGTIKMVVQGGLAGSNPVDGPVMIDNITVTESGLLILQEDPGNNARLSKIWMYDPAADNGVDQFSGLTPIGQHDPARFTDAISTTGALAPFGTTNFGQDEESSGVIDVTSMLGNNQKLAFLLDTQAHYNIAGELVEGGQLMKMTIDLPNAGNSEFDGTAGNDVYDGGFGNDEIEGGKGDDRLFGNYGNDEIYGGKGNDTLDGGVGNDRVHGDGGNDSISGGTGDDMLFGDEGKDTIDGGVGDDRVYGGDGDDVLSGGFGKDSIFGGAGKDKLEGNQGADTLDGGKGDDILIGGGGDDRFIVSEGNDTLVFKPSFGNDTVVGFDASPNGGQDLLDFTAFGFTAATFASHVAITDIGDDTLIKIDGIDSIKLLGIHDATTVTISDFII
jgi:Ca2+-binding RTX toxin-like protein